MMIVNILNIIFLILNILNLILVFLRIFLFVNDIDDAPFGMPHPIHMHGHHFHVLKTGFPHYNSTTGEILDRNRDIKCSTKSCNGASWRNEEWNFGNVPGLNLENPPQKDTIAVPRNGYVVVRLKADNPGYLILSIK